MTKAFAKVLTANDIGKTGSHQAGALVPKRDLDLAKFLPYLDPGKKNPDAWIFCTDPLGNVWKMRYVYYNNKLHDPTGTRDESRITYMTSFFKKWNAQVGDEVVLTQQGNPNHFLIEIVRAKSLASNAADGPATIKLVGWRRVH